MILFIIDTLVIALKQCSVFLLHISGWWNGLLHQPSSWHLAFWLFKNVYRLVALVNDKRFWDYSRRELLQKSFEKSQLWLYETIYSFDKMTFWVTNPTLLYQNFLDVARASQKSSNHYSAHFFFQYLLFSETDECHTMCKQIDFFIREERIYLVSQLPFGQGKNNRKQTIKKASATTPATLRN